MPIVAAVEMNDSLRYRAKLNNGDKVVASSDDRELLKDFMVGFANGEPYRIVDSAGLVLPFSEEPWTPWFDYDDKGFIVDAGVDCGPNRAANVCVTCCENVEIEDKDKFNAYIMADTKLLAAAPKLFRIALQIIANCQLGRSSRHQFADGKGSLAGCDISLETIREVQTVIEEITGTRPTVGEISESAAAKGLTL